MICPIHNKEMKYHPKFGWSCPTPIEKDGNTVTKWCDYKPPKDTPTGPSEDPQPYNSEKNGNSDPTAEGKVRHGLSVAVIENQGLVSLTSEMKEILEGWKAYIMNGK